MKRILPCIFLLFALLPCSANASTLTHISRIDKKDIVQYYFSFDETPEFSSIRSDRRIDLEFFSTAIAPSLSLGEPDGDIVKILPRPEKDRLILSLFFRYRPQHHKLTKSPDGKLVFEVLLGNEYSKSYQDMADRLKGLTVVERLSSDITNPYLNTPYVKDWMSFFSEFESSVNIEAPVKFSSPPFPIISMLPPEGKNNLQLITAEMFKLAEKNLWDELAGELLALIENTLDAETKKLLALTYGEALSRSGNFEEAYRQLYLLKDEYSDELLGTYANYLLLHLSSLYQAPYIADNGYHLLESSMSSNLPLAPYFRLSQIEAALAAKNHKRLNHLLLREDVAFPEQIVEILQIRQADYWYAIDQQIKARAAYQLHADSSALQSLPYSLSSTCNINYKQKRYEEAASCYRTLSTLVTDKSLAALIDYKKAMSYLKEKDKESLIDEFSNIENNFYSTEAGFRAGIKRNDLLFLDNKSWGPDAITNYAAIAKKAKSREIREEALFKQALVHAILGDAAKSIHLLQQYLREFLTGDVRISAQALLIELLPGEIKRLVDNKEHIQALVLAKQNKDLFRNRWIEGKFLVDIAEAYNRIGIYDEAQKLYLYLIETMPIEEREDLFLPMIQATFDNGNFSLVEDYAAQYTYSYPDGLYRTDIFYFRLQALVADERLSDALQLLPDPLPEDRAFYELAISLFFRTDNYIECLEAAKKLAKKKESLSQKEQFMLAESLFRTGSYDEAESAFIAITEESNFFQQSLYRLAELARQKGNEKKALRFFEKLVETEKNSLWKQYAERDLQFAKAAARM
ncbi:MAG: tetratricopeptide repeat protein [Desulforhopalus sp.]